MDDPVNDPVNEPVNEPVKRCIEFIKTQIRNNRTRQHPIRTAGGSLFIIMQKKVHPINAYFCCQINPDCI